MRGAISYIVKRYTKPNNKYMTACGSSEKSSYCLFRCKLFKWI